LCTSWCFVYAQVPTYVYNWLTERALQHIILPSNQNKPEIIDHTHVE